MLDPPYVRPCDRERGRAAPSDDGGGDSGAGPPGVIGGGSEVKGPAGNADGKHSAAMRTGISVPQCGQPIMMTATSTGTGAADILELAPCNDRAAPRWIRAKILM